MRASGCCPLSSATTTYGSAAGAWQRAIDGGAVDARALGVRARRSALGGIAKRLESQAQVGVDGYTGVEAEDVTLAQERRDFTRESAAPERRARENHVREP